ncbi:MAG: DUF3710 domain-containing protein [Oryzihumus sp.]
MSLFRRGSKSAPPTGSDAVEPEVTPADEAGLDQTRADQSGAGQSGTDQPIGTAGPYDRGQVPGPEGRLDLGSLWVAGVPGMELRLEVDDETQSIVGVTAVLGESAVQLQAFAAPRSEGLWEEIRREIASSITRQGGTADEVSGPLGAELQTRMPGQAPDGRTIYSPARFLGVDGPRWFLRAVLSGRAAVDQDAATPLIEMVSATVVVRGDEAMAPRDLLPLQLPSEEQHTGDQAPEPPAAEDFTPFERGPEITEIR